MAMSSASMEMSSVMPTGTTMAPMASSTGMAGSMDGMSMGGSCKISVSLSFVFRARQSLTCDKMLWNWYTVDACFVARSWHITSKGMFAGSCIGVILLVVALEFLRRAGKEYDHYIVAQHTKSLAPTSASASSASFDHGTSKVPAAASSAACGPVAAAKFRPSIVQQAIRALLHMLQFAVAYFVMLLAMYYNGYIIICIFIGAYLGYFIFDWESFSVGQGGRDRMQENATVCCG
jgi:copper transporter 1